MPAWLGSGESFLQSLQMIAFSLCPQMGDEEGDGEGETERKSEDRFLCGVSSLL